MAIVHDVIPPFQLFQPTTLDEALDLVAARGREAWVLAGGMDSLDWLKDRTRRTSAVIELGQIAGTARHSRGGRRPRDRRHDDAHRGGRTRRRAGAVRRVGRGGQPRRVAADPQPGHARRQRVAGHALRLLPPRLGLLPRRRQHLLRRHAHGHQPRTRHPAGRSLRGGEPVRHRAGADCPRRADGHSPARWRARGRRPPTTSSGRAPTSRA